MPHQFSTDVFITKAHDWHYRHYCQSDNPIYLQFPFYLYQMMLVNVKRDICEKRGLHFKVADFLSLVPF